MTLHLDGGVDMVYHFVCVCACMWGHLLIIRPPGGGERARANDHLTAAANIYIVFTPSATTLSMLQRIISFNPHNNPMG